MKKALSLRLFGSSLVLTSLLVAVLTLAVRNQSSAHNSTKSFIVSPSGQKLTTLFEGSGRDPRYSSKAILASRSALPKCGRKPGTSDIGEVVQRLFGSRIVYATCLITECSGTGWVNHTDYCNTGGGCSGAYYNATTDPSSNFGNFQDRTHCGTNAACGCDLYAC
jgi:hypothetical protein